MPETRFPTDGSTKRRPPSRRITFAALLCALLTVGLLDYTGGAAAAKPTPPPNPTNGQINSAQAEKARLADEVGSLSAKISAMQTRINQLKDAAELAEQKYAYAVQKLQDAKTAAATARNKVTAAAHRVTAAQREYQSFVASTYMSGDVGGTTESLLTASDPNVLLQTSAMEQYESDHQLDAIGNLRRATVAKSNADAAARLAVQKQQDAKIAAAQAKNDAIDAVQSAQAQEKSLQASLAANQRSLHAAQLHLATLNHERAQYIAYQKHQAWLRKQREIARQKRIEAAKRAHQRELRRERLQRQRERERERHQKQHNGGGKSGGGNQGGGGHHGGGSVSPPPTPSGGGWSQAKGDEAVRRAKRELGVMYAWAGGNASGPTYGVCAGDGAWNDCHVKGFDCSGLTLFAWAPYESLPHYSVAQYYDAGTFHPSTSQLKPGDLVFWSSNGTVGGIHHVAIYIGGGYVIQAPQSGEVIQETPLSEVDWGYYGATRPLTHG